ncbi:MAG: type IX secretion system membrane protein PorP/SprF [Crocinitomicaceae bacterium]
MKKQLLLFALFVGTVGSSYAQQDKVLTHFMFDRITVNPAATALKRNQICGTFIYRNQWDKINGAPNSGTFNVEADLDQYVPHFFAGISFFQDMIGFNRQNFATLNFGYSFSQYLPFDLRAGVGIGIMNHSVDPLWLPPDVSASLDPSIQEAGWSRTGFDANFGLYARHTLLTGTRQGDSWNFGISMTHLPGAELQDPGSLPPAPQIIGFQSVRHLYFMGGYKLNEIVAGRDDIDFQFMVQTDQIEFSAQLSARYMYDDKIYGGLNFRSEDMIGLMAGVNLANVSNNTLPPLIVGYAYDFTINQLSTISQGTHEVMVRYCYPLPGIPLTITKHPRWL